MQIILCTCCLEEGGVKALSWLDGKGRGEAGQEAGVGEGFMGLGCFTKEVRGGGIEAGSFSKSLKQALAAALPRCRTLIRWHSGGTTRLQETEISRLLSGSSSWVLSGVRRGGGA